MSAGSVITIRRVGISRPSLDMSLQGEETGPSHHEILSVVIPNTGIIKFEGAQKQTGCQMAADVRFDRFL